MYGCRSNETRKNKKCHGINCLQCRSSSQFSFSLLVVVVVLEDLAPILIEIFFGGALTLLVLCVFPFSMLLFRRKNPALPELLLVELRRFGPPEVNLTSSSSSSSSRRRFSDNRSGGGWEGGVVGLMLGSCVVRISCLLGFSSCFWACVESICVSMASSSSSSG